MDVDGEEAVTALNGEASEASGIPALPSEVVEQVFRLLSMTDRLSFARVSSTFAGRCGTTDT